MSYCLFFMFLCILTDVKATESHKLDGYIDSIAFHVRMTTQWTFQYRFYFGFLFSAKVHHEDTQTNSWPQCVWQNERQAREYTLSHTHTLTHVHIQKTLPMNIWEAVGKLELVINSNASDIVMVLHEFKTVCMCLCVWVSRWNMHSTEVKTLRWTAWNILLSTNWFKVPLLQFHAISTNMSRKRNTSHMRTWTFSETKKKTGQEWEKTSIFKSKWW